MPSAPASPLLCWDLPLSPLGPGLLLKVGRWMGKRTRDSFLLVTESESHLVASNSLWPHGLQSPWNSPGQNTGVGSLSLLQGIFPTQGSNLGLPHCRQILYHVSHKEGPVEVLNSDKVNFTIYSFVIIAFSVLGNLCLFPSHENILNFSLKTPWF